MVTGRPTSELTPPVIVDEVAYEVKVRANILVALIIAFTFIITCWTWKPPDLPGDSAGVILGGFIGWIGGMLTTWGTAAKK